jgi:hypothetical protein
MPGSGATCPWLSGIGRRTRASPAGSSPSGQDPSDRRAKGNLGPSTENILNKNMSGANPIYDHKLEHQRCKKIQRN